MRVAMKDDILLNSKEIKRLVLMRCNQLKVNLNDIARVTGIDREKISMWLWFHTSNFKYKEVKITRVEMLEVFAALAVKVVQIGNQIYLVARPKRESLVQSRGFQILKNKTNERKKK